ncbi:MAG: nuclear transport factor 2 family protein [Actinobacteria bacterium]|nr:nuclear transport factor 2 family protein [Actinomycetota bacterium]
MDHRVEQLIERIAALEGEVRRLRDESEIRRLIAGYGPAVDACVADAVAECWTADGTYDVGPVYPTMTGGQDFVDMVSSETHTGLVAGGCGHVMSAPLIHLEGDEAVAVGHHQLIRHDPDEDRFVVWRLTASRWNLVRTDDGWRCRHRVHRMMNAEGDGKALFAEAVAEFRARRGPTGS